MARMDVSGATLRNWQRLDSDVENKLQHRANKSCSGKRIFPLEYIQNKDTLIFIEQVLLLAQTKGVSRYDIIYSLAVKLLEKAGIADTRRARLTLLEFSGTLLSEFPALPADEADILGLVYQCLLLEGEKNKNGSYYTPSDVTTEMLAGFDFSGGKTFFDPCCGSGAFLLAAKVESPLQLWGCDKDLTAVFMAKVNDTVAFTFTPINCAAPRSSETAFMALPGLVLFTNSINPTIITIQVMIVTMVVPVTVICPCANVTEGQVIILIKDLVSAPKISNAVFCNK